MKFYEQRFQAGKRRMQWAAAVVALLGFTSALWAQPANDNFASATVLTGVSGVATSSSADATAEPGEPRHGGSSAVASVWYQWTAPVDGLCTFDTFGSSYDTTLAVYENAGFPVLQLQAENDNLPDNLGVAEQSGVKLYVRAGVTYHIAVDGADTGEVMLNWGYQHGGVFQFTTLDFVYSETESVPIRNDEPGRNRSVRGALITVTRLFGTAGRVEVDYQTADGSGADGTDYVATTGTLVFEDFELSKSFFVPVIHNEDGVDDVDFTVSLSAPRFAADDAAAAGWTVAPALNPGAAETTVTLYNVDPPDPEDPDQDQETILSFQKAVYRAVENYNNQEVYSVTLYVNRYSKGERKQVKASWTMNSRPVQAENNIFHEFDLQPGSDYALPSEGTNSSAGSDFVHASGTLDWGQDDFNPKPITITITNDSLIEFNEDLVVQLHSPDPANDAQNRIRFSSRLGNGITVGEYTLTLLFDDQPAGSLDAAHNPDNNALTTPPYMANPGANGAVYAINVQPDGKALIGGSFTVVNAEPRNRIARMNVDGSLDMTFNPGSGANGFVTCMDLDSSGRVIIGGGFTSVNGLQRYRIARLNANGSVDTTFNPGLGADGVIWALDVIQSTDPLENGKVLIAGEFQSFNGLPRQFVARLNQNGSVDTTFDPGLGPDWVVNSVLAAPNGQVWIGGAFFSVAGNLLPGVARLNYSGTVDPAFNPGSGFDGEVFSLDLQNDGKLLAGGLFNQFGGVDRRGLARLNPDGSLDPTFDPGTGADDVIYQVKFVAGAVPQDPVEGTDRIYIAGQFKEFNQTRRVALARLYANGTVDTTFMDTAYNQFAGLPNARTTDPRNYLLAVAVQVDGNVLIGGGFDLVGGSRLRTGTQPDVNDTETLTRAAYRPRANFARLLGGETVGPGQVRFTQSDYGVDENDPTGFITLSRDNGTLGVVTARFTTVARPAGPGAAVIDTDFDCLSTTPTFATAWNSEWMRSSGIYGPNNNSTPVNSGSDDVLVPIIANTLVDGNRAFDMLLSVPYQADAFYLGGENIPTGFALGYDAASSEILDDDFSPGVLGFSAPAYSISENGVAALITVTRTNGTAGAVSVRYETITGPAPSATAGADYTYRIGTLNFLDGQVSKVFPVPIVNDTALEPDENIGLRLFEPTGGATLGLSNAVLTIIDNDYANGRVAFTSATYVTNESAGAALITVARTGGSVGTLAVTYSTAPGPTNAAVEGVDYFGVTNTLVWANNESGLKSFTIPLIPDGVIEPDKTVSLKLATPLVNGVADPNAQGSVSNAVLTILNDDLRGTVAFSTDTFLVNENSGQTLITVVRQGGSAESITVDYSTAPSPGGRFNPVSGTLNFGPGVVSQSFPITINDDALVNGNLIVTLNLTNVVPPKGLGSPDVASLTIVDNETFNEPPGAIDTTLNPALGFDDTVFTLGLQPDGDIVAGGAFTKVNGIGRNRIARLNGDGSLDLGFGTTTGGANDVIHTLDLQSDGRILIGGSFTTINGVNRARLARLNLNGTTDIGFDPGSGLDGTVFAVAESFVNGTRRILAAGAFTTANGAQHTRIARFLDNGELDDSFNPGAGANGAIYALAVQPDGKILVGGDFTQFNGSARLGMARLNPDGSLDGTFAPGCDGIVRAIALQGDDRILLGGTFTQVNGAPRMRVARLSADGALDTGFQPGLGANDTVLSLVVQGDTRILVGGQFTRASGVTRRGITRLDPDGTVDPTINFGFGANNSVSAILSQPWDGRIVLGGAFTEYDSQPALRLARLYGGSFSGSGTFEFTRAAYSVNENGTNAVITVRRRNGTSNATGGEVSVTFATSNGTALSGVDYTGLTNVLVFAEGQVFQEVPVPILDDSFINADRTVNLALSNPQPPGEAGIGNQPFATLTIVNDDSGLGFLSSAYTRSEDAVDGKAIIDLKRTGSSVGSVSATFSTTTDFGTAVPGVDYMAVTQVVTFADGETAKSVFVPIFDNQQIDGDRTVGLTLSAPIGAQLVAPTTALLTIQDDEQFTGLPANDRFALAQGLSGQKGSVNGSNIGATASPNEPDHGGVTAAHSIWYEWTAPSAGLVVFDTLGSSFDTTLSIYTGDNLAALQRVASNDNFPQGPNPAVNLTASAVKFYAFEGVTYKIAVDGRGEGSVVLNWSYNSAGMFQFTTAIFNCSETESAVLTPSTTKSAPGALITVTRLFGSRGRVRVFYATIAGSAREGEDYSGGAGTLVFEDFELSKSFIIPIVNQPGKMLSRAFSVALTGVALDAEDQDVGIGDPYLNPDLSQATVNILDIDEWPGGLPPEAPYAIFNVERRYLRTPEGVGVVRVGVRRTGVGAMTCSVRYTINSQPPPAENDLYRTFSLQSGSDYATPGEDFTHVSGQLQFAGAPGDIEYFDIAITNDTLVEFNEDLLVQLHSPEPQPNTTVGRVGVGNVTILFDDLPAGSLDPGHNPDYNALTTPPQMANPGANGAVYGIALQADDKPVIVGSFTVVNVAARNRIARMNADGSLDTTFDPGTGANGLVTCVDIGPDGKAVIGGNFTSVNGQQRYRVARLNANGSLDTSFNPGGGLDAVVRAVDVLSDGRVLLAGEFLSVNGFPRKYVVRLNSDGSVDQTFDPGVGPNAHVNDIVGAASGEVWIGGPFTSVSGNFLPGVARLESSGAVHPAFVPGAGFNGEVFALELQANGRLLVGGNFTEFNLVPRNGLARLAPDGLLDAGFDPGTGADDVIHEIVYVTAAVPTDSGLGTDRIYVAGQFQQFNQTRRVTMARLYPDGTVDTTFLDMAYNQFAGLGNPRATDSQNQIFAMAVQPDGNVLIGGDFERVGGGRLNTTVQPYVNDTIPESRAAYRPRANFARLLGGETGGPGQILFPQVQYGAAEGSATAFINLERVRGTLGPASTVFTTVARPPGPGAAVIGTDFQCLAFNPVFIDSWPITPMLSDGIFGTNNNTRTVTGGFLNSTLDDIYIPIIPDAVVDGNRAMDMTLTLPSQSGEFFLGGENIAAGVALGRSLAATEIFDDDYTPGVLGFSEATYSLTENGGAALITVVRTNGTAGAVSIRYETLDGTAAAPGDYTATAGRLDFFDGQVSKTFLVPIVNDTALEPDETILLRLFSVTGGATGGLTNAVLTIIDNDYANGRVAFAASSFATNEDAGSAVITVTRNGGSAGTLAVTAFTAPGPTNSAVAGVDYLGVTNTLVWANNESGPKTFSVPLVSDFAIEPDKTVSLQLSNPLVNGVLDTNALGSLSSAVLTILNDDLRGAVSFSATGYLANENSGQALVTVSRQGGAAESISVNFAANTFEAVAGVDFLATNGTLNFGPGEVSQSFLVTLLDNNRVDGNRRVALNLSGATPPVALVNPVSAQLTIVDDETFNEPPGTVDTTLNPLLGFDGPIFALGLQPNGSIVAAGDFTQVNGIPRQRIARLRSDASLDIGFGTTVGGADGVLRTLALQGDGRILVGGSFTAINGFNRGRIARLDLDGTTDLSFDPGSGLDGAVFAVAESSVNGTRRILAAGAFTTADGAPRRRIARFLDNGELDTSFQPGDGADGIIYALVVQPDGRILIGGDFTQYAGVLRSRVARLNSNGSLDLTFNPGTGLDGSVRAIALQGDDRILLGGSFTNYNGVGRVRLARLNADASLDTGFNPGVGLNDTVYTVVLQGDTRILVGGEFTEASGVTRRRLTRLNPDGTVDPSINFGFGANSFVGAILAQPWDGRIVLAGGFTEYDTQPAARLTRIYGGSVSGSGNFEFTRAGYSVNENGTNALISVRRRNGTSGAPTGDVQVTFSTSNGTALAGTNYLAVTNTLSFPPGETLRTVGVPVLDDILINVDRTVNLLLSNPRPTNGPALGNQPSAVLTIVNDDSAVRFSSATYTRSEAAIDGKATLQILRSGSTVGPASVDFATGFGGNAVPGVDYTPVILTVNFADGESNKSVFVPIFDNLLADGNRTVNLELSNPVGSLLLAPSLAVLTIEDDEQLPGALTFLTNAVIVAEGGGSALLTVLRTNGSSGVVSLNYAASDGTAMAPFDYLPTAGVLTFADGETSKSIAVPIVDDPQVEITETFQVALSNPTGGATLAGTPIATVSIVDNDVGIGFSSASYVVAESDPSVTIAVLRLSGTNGVSTVQYTTTNLTAQAGADYVATSGTLTFAPGETLKTFTVSLLADNEVEGDQSFAVLLRNPSAGVQLFQPNATVTILDDDAGLLLSSATYSVSESETNLVVTVVRTNSNVGVVTVNYSTSDGTAVANEDYAPVNGLLAFAEGQFTQSFQVPIINDTALEPEETFNITLFNPSAGAKLLTPSTAVVTITDNDAGLSFSAPSYSVNENGVAATITVVRTGVTNSVVSVDYSTANGTATAGEDYQPASGTLVFASGELSRTFGVQVIDDTVVEADETVILTLLNPVGQVSVITPSSAELVILDDDGSLVSAAGAALLSESGPVNGAIDPGETVTLWLALRNVIGDPTTNLVGTLLATNGVTPSGVVTANYGALQPGGASVSRQFTFTANGTNGSRIAATLRLQDGTNALGGVGFQFALGTGVVSFTNTAPISIPMLGSASPYPATIGVSGVEGVISATTVTLSNLHHGSPADLDMLLVAPGGTRSIVMSDVGGNVAVTNLNLRLLAAATNTLSTSGPLVSGDYQPRNNLFGDAFPAPAPVGPYTNDSFTVFNGLNPNGTWSLYIVDDLNLLSGAVAGGWALGFEFSGVIPASTDLSIAGTASPQPVIRGQNITYTLTVTNHGPSAASAVTLTNGLPANGELISAVTTQGTVNTNTPGVIIASLGGLAKDASATVTVVVRTTVAGSVLSQCGVSGGQTDPNTGNNVLTLQSTVEAPYADLALVMGDAPDPAYVGGSLVYTLAVTNLGPSEATSVVLSNTLPAGVQFLSAVPAGYVVNAGVVTFTNLGALPSGSGTAATITVRTLVPATLTNAATVASALNDPLKGNNTTSVKTVVIEPSLTWSVGMGSLSLKWPAAASGYSLQRATNLVAPILWMPATNPPPQLINGEYVYTVSTTNAGGYFRLRGALP